MLSHSCIVSFFIVTINFFMFFVLSQGHFSPPLLLEKEEGRERNIDWLPLICTWTGRDQTCHPGACRGPNQTLKFAATRGCSNELSHTGQRVISSLCFFFKLPICLLLIFLFNFLKRFYLFIYREMGRERNIDVWLPLMCPLLRPRPTTQACALTGNRARHPLVHRWALNPLSQTSQGCLLLIFLRGVFFFFFFFGL